MGYTARKKKGKTKTKVLNSPIRNRLWNCINKVITYSTDVLGLSTLSGIHINELLTKIYDKILKIPLEEIDKNLNKTAFKIIFDDFNKDQVFDLIEIIISHLKTQNLINTKYNSFIENINQILDEENILYKIKNDLITEIGPTELENLVKVSILTNDPENIDKRIDEAITLFFKRNSKKEDKKHAIITLGYVLEYLKKSDKLKSLPNEATSNLFNILNNFDLRHHNPDQKRDYDQEIWYEWIFYTTLASLRTVQKLIKD